MTIKTLEYIHRIMIREEEKLLTVYKYARDQQYAAEAAESQDVEQKKQEADSFWKLHSEALDALQEFENQDWR